MSELSSTYPSKEEEKWVFEFLEFKIFEMSVSILAYPYAFGTYEQTVEISPHGFHTLFHGISKIEVKANLLM